MLFRSFEETDRVQILVIYPGRFQPWHKGHKAVYDYLTQQFGRDNVFIATSNKVDPPRSPFSFSEKIKFMNLTGVSSDRIVETRDPYKAIELVQNYNPQLTRLVFAVSEKDMAEDPRFKFGVKKDGTPTKLQPMPKNPKDMKPMTDHFYLMVTPTVNFKVQGADANSASEIRNKYISGKDADRDQIITDLYGETYPELKDTFDKKLGASQQAQKIVQEARKHTLTESARKRLSYILETIIQQERAIQLNESFSDEPVNLNLDYLEEKRGL